MRRRTYIAMVGSASLAGCVGGPGETDEAETDGQASTEQPTEQSTEAPDSAGFQKLWENDPEVTTTSSHVQLAADEEVAYLGTDSELTALSLADGTEQWTLSLDTPLDGMAIDDDGLFTLQTETVQAIDPDTGESRWVTTAANRESGSRVVTTDEHVAAGRNGGALVFGKESGQQTARLTGDYGDPLRAWNGQFVVAEESGMTAYDPDGTVQWTIEDVWLSWLSPVAGSTVVGSARIGSQSGTFVGIDLENGSQRWTTDVSTDIPYPMTAATDDTVFVHSGDDYADTFYALDVETGDVRWTVGGADFAPFPPVVLESGVVIDLDEGVQARDRKTGEQIVSTDELEGFIEATGSGRTIVLYSLNRAAYQL